MYIIYEYIYILCYVYAWVYVYVYIYIYIIVCYVCMSSYFIYNIYLFMHILLDVCLMAQFSGMSYSTAFCMGPGEPAHIAGYQLGSPWRTSRRSRQLWIWGAHSGHPILVNKWWIYVVDISGGYKWFLCPNMLASIASRDKLPVDAELFRRGNIYIYYIILYNYMVYYIYIYSYTCYKLAASY